jgi:hypothetical protein
MSGDLVDITGYRKSDQAQRIRRARECHGHRDQADRRGLGSRSGSGLRAPRSSTAGKSSGRASRQRRSTSWLGLDACLGTRHAPHGNPATPHKESRMYARQERPRVGFLAACAASALLAVPAVIAAGAGDPSDARTRYLQERAMCDSGESHQDRATCLREAGAAYDQARRGGLDDGRAQYQLCKRTGPMQRPAARGARRLPSSNTGPGRNARKRRGRRYLQGTRHSGNPVGRRLTTGERHVAGRTQDARRGPEVIFRGRPHRRLIEIGSGTSEPSRPAWRWRRGIPAIALCQGAPPRNEIKTRDVAMPRG